MGLFPGQGLEPAVVLSALPEHHPLLKQAAQSLGFDLRRRVERITRHSQPLLPTDLAQPAIFVAGVIAFRDAEQRGGSFDFLVGHSLGEYTALVAVGAIPFSHGLRLVSARGAAMKKAAAQTDGGMAAVMGLPVEQVEALCAAVGATFANDNSPSQAVVSGSGTALDRAAPWVRSRGGRTVLLPIDGAYHSEAMTSAEASLAIALERTDVRSPKIPIVSNVTARPYRSPGEIRKLLLTQLTHKVRFRGSIEWLTERGATEFVDLGPGRVVGRLARASIPRYEEAAAHA